MDLENVIQQLRQAEETLNFVRETILSLQEPVLAHLSVLYEHMMDAYSEHLEALVRFPENAVDQQEEESDAFEELFHEVSRALARKRVAASRTSAPLSSAADQLAAETWLKQQLKMWESLKVDVPNQFEEAMPQNQGIEIVVANTPSEFGTDPSRTLIVNKPNSDDSRPRELSDDTDVVNRRPQQRSAEPDNSIDPVKHPASTGSPIDVALKSSRDQPLPAVFSNLGHSEDGSNIEPGPDPAQTPKTNNHPCPGRVHSNSGHSKKVIEKHNLLLPSMVKDPDKRGHPNFCRFHPDYGVVLRSDGR